MNKNSRRFQPHELLWLQAADKLHGMARPRAFREIADMTGRNYHAIRDKAYRLRRDNDRAWLLALKANQSAGIPDQGRGPYKPRSQNVGAKLSTCTSAGALLNDAERHNVVASSSFQGDPVNTD
jgi:hypothetical protein